MMKYIHVITHMFICRNIFFFFVDTLFLLWIKSVFKTHNGSERSSNHDCSNKSSNYFSSIETNISSACSWNTTNKSKFTSLFQTANTLLFISIYISVIFHLLWTIDWSLPSKPCEFITIQSRTRRDQTTAILCWFVISFFLLFTYSLFHICAYHYSRFFYALENNEK